MAQNHLDKRPKDERTVWEDILARGTPDQIHKMFVNRIILDLNIEGISKNRLAKIFDNPRIVLPGIEAVLRGGGHR